MPAVAEYARPISASVRPDLDTESTLQPQGSEGRQLHRKADEASRHWGERAEVLVAATQLFISGCDEAKSEQTSYVAVPPNRTFFVRTRYIYAGRGEPLPFELDVE